MSKLETGSFNFVMHDFNFITGIYLHTDKCGPREMIRFDEANKKAERITINEFLIK